MFPDLEDFVRYFTLNGLVRFQQLVALFFATLFAQKRRSVSEATLSDFFIKTTRMAGLIGKP